MASEYLRNSTFCLILRGDNEATKKFTEVVVSGCVPVLLADMPALPFDRRLDYAAFSYEFHWHEAGANPEALVEWLLARPAAEVRAKQAALMRARRHFYFHADTTRDGAVTQLIADLCAANVSWAKSAQPRSDDKMALYAQRLAALGAPTLQQGAAPSM